ncbi:RNA-binding protein [Candidatus Peregrinibacteria bacterium CG_4_9_14_0_2_um_filter_53_11]|nr:MAG: RNA-binding protein [Candidatus Peregrinibacteria bacterium CG_4_9_14_0_2_um_filter_53_11]
MSKKLFVGNISWGVSDEDLKAAFAVYGEIEEAVIIKDKFSGRSKGFGFVTFVNGEDADAAVAAMDGKELDGRPLAVNEARPPKPREDRY